VPFGKGFVAGRVAATGVTTIAKIINTVAIMSNFLVIFSPFLVEITEAPLPVLMLCFKRKALNDGFSKMIPEY
jgi:hypothetical protein